MFDLPMHPKIVHLPMALAVLMPLIAGGLLLAWWRQWLPSRAWLMAVGLQGVLVLSSVMAMRSGEGDEERVEKVVSGKIIHEHEEAAELFTWTAAGLFAVMIGAALTASRRPGLPLAAVAALGTLGVAGLGYRAGQAGGELVYRHGAAQVFASGAALPQGPVHDGAGPKEGDED